MSIIVYFLTKNGEIFMKENQRITLTKRLLKEALLRLLKKKEIDKINVSELCSEAGINRATFYRHYETPADVLQDIEKDFIQGLDISFKVPLNLQDIAKEYERLCTYLQDHLELVKILIRCNSNSYFPKILELFYQQLRGTKYADNLDEDSIRLIITGIAGGGHALLRTWILEDIKKTPKEMAELLIQFMNYGNELF